MENSVFFIKSENKEKRDLTFSFCGVSKTEPLHSFGPSVRETYILHIILSGSGYYMVDGKKFHLRGGEGFLIEPGISTFYQSDIKDPWTYLWIGFSGKEIIDKYLKRAGLTSGNYSFSVSNTEIFLDYIQKCFSKIEHTLANELFLDAYTFEFLASLVENARPITNAYEVKENEYINEALHYLYNNYTKQINVTDIANNLNVNRSYLSRIFKESIGMTIKEYLLELRINHASDLLSMSTLSIETVALESGFTNPEMFSKLFKKERGRTPKEYRKERKEITDNLHKIQDYLEKFLNENKKVRY